MNYKVKAEFIGKNNEGKYEKISQVYLIPSPNFSDAEKAVITMIKDDEDPKKDTVMVRTMAEYSVSKVIYLSEDIDRNVFDETRFYEATVEVVTLVNNKEKPVKVKLLIESNSIESAREISLRDHGYSEKMFNEEKVIQLKETDVYKSLI